MSGSVDTQLELVSSEEQVTIVAFSGDLDSYGVSRIKDDFLKFTDTCRILIVQMRKVQFAGSAAISMFAAAAQTLQKKDGSLRLVKAEGYVLGAFRATGLTEVVEIYPTLEAAQNTKEAKN